MRFEKVVILFALIFVLISADDFEDNKCDSKFCEEDPNYPEQLLDSLKLWEHDWNSQPEKQSRKRSISSMTTSDSFIETKLCDSSISFKRPQKLKNINDKLRTIVNHRNYTQLVRFEIYMLEPKLSMYLQCIPQDSDLVLPISTAPRSAVGL